MPKWLRLTLPGLCGAALFLVLSFTPSLLPRPPLFQGLIGGIAAAIGYGLGVGAAWIWRGFANRRRRHPSKRTWLIFAVIAVIAYLAAAGVGEFWQSQSRNLMQIEDPSIRRFLTVPLIALLIFGLLVSIGRGLRRLYRGLSKLLERRFGPRASRATGWTAVTIGTFLALSGLVWDPLINAVDSSFALADTAEIDTLPVPEADTRSGSEASLVSWESLGREGRRFVTRGPSAADIEELTSESALEPIRAYAGTATAEDVEERAIAAVDDLERAGGFDREYLMVAGTTGSGFVEPSAADSFEYFTGGDSAIVAIQYSHLPSWISFLVDQDNARNAGRALFDEVYNRWSQLPADNRPELYLFGESLGSFSLETAFSGESDLANRTSGGLFVGPPNFNTLYTEFRDRRDEGSREIEPIFRNGRTVRFTLDAAEPADPVGSDWDEPRVLYLVNASDPITWWSPDLIWNRPDWLTEQRGPDVNSSMRWIPIITFWQTSADMAVGMSPPPGHGHNFVGEHVYGWHQVLGITDWSEGDVAELVELMLETRISPATTPGD